MDLGLRGRRALITGGSKGIGLAVAQQYAAEGVDVCLVARSDEALATAAEIIRSSSDVDVFTAAADLSLAPDRQRVCHLFPDVDIVVNNAGAIPFGSIDQVEDSAWRESWDLKVYGYIDLTRRYLELMRARRRGVILNVIGSGGERLTYSYVAGSTGNAALMAFTRIIGAKSPTFGVRVVGLNPGPVASERVGQFATVSDELGDVPAPTPTIKVPFGRLATPAEIAATAVFLTSDLSSYTTGTIVTVDGGLTYYSESG